MEPKVYTVSEIQELLGIGRSAAYEYIKKWKKRINLFE